MLGTPDSSKRPTLRVIQGGIALKSVRRKQLEIASRVPGDDIAPFADRGVSAPDGARQSRLSAEKLHGVRLQHDTRPRLLTGERAAMTETMTLGARVRWALEHAGMNQTELAKAIGVGKGAISQWSLDQIDSIRPDNLFAAARVLRVEAEWLGTGKGPRTPIERVAPDVDPEIARLIDALPPESRRPLLALVTALLRSRSSRWEE